ncbi:hypothetical protein [Pedobacter nyackensis]|uniref:hypothetical protein n=1 Tax=Pedobacter nyackensis TaxID=475255 RepID=UPI002930EE97|nr:hypothetical protein [Pedobacter nyackensis]
MKRIIFMAAIALSFSACDNTKLQLRAVESESNEATAQAASPKSDTLVTDTIKKDSLVLH